MINAVIDTNILVSALLTPTGNSAEVFNYVMNGIVNICYDSRVIAEYSEVLLWPKFNFDEKTVKQVIDYIIYSGVSIIPVPIMDAFEDENDKVFYEVSTTAKAYLVTGNVRHFPKKHMVLTPKEFLNVVNNYLAVYYERS